MKHDQSKLPWHVDYDNVVDSMGYWVCEARDNAFQIVHEHNLILGATGEIFDDSKFIGSFRPYSLEELKEIFEKWHKMHDWRESPVPHFELYLAIPETARFLATINQMAKLHTTKELMDDAK